MADGSVVAAEKITSTSPESPRYFILESPGHSCASRYDDFEKGEYVVSVTRETVTLLSNTEFDNEFTFYFDSLLKAQEKYNELMAQESNIQTLSTYVTAGYTLRPV